MSIQYVGLNSGAQVTRDFWRVTLGAGFSLRDLTGGPLSDFDPWATKVEQWRAGAMLTPAIASPAATSGNQTPIPPDARAVVDVHILGAESGVSVSSLVGKWDTMVSRVDVLRVERISSLTDSEGRSKALQDASAQAQRESLSDRIFRYLQKSLLVVGILAAGGLALYFYLSRRK